MPRFTCNPAHCSQAAFHCQALWHGQPSSGHWLWFKGRLTQMMHAGCSKHNTLPVQNAHSAAGASACGHLLVFNGRNTDPARHAQPDNAWLCSCLDSIACASPSHLPICSHSSPASSQKAAPKPARQSCAPTSLPPGAASLPARPSRPRQANMPSSYSDACIPLPR